MVPYKLYLNNTLIEDVCFDIVLTTTHWGNENSWVLGTCASTIVHENDIAHESECCLPPGEYTLECRDSYGDGWHGGYITVNGNKYCENFDSSSLETHEILISADTDPEGKIMVHCYLDQNLFEKKIKYVFNNV